MLGRSAATQNHPNGESKLFQQRWEVCRCADASIMSGSDPAVSDARNVSSPSQILIGEVTSFFVKTERAQEKTIVTADCCYFNPLLRRIVRFLGQLHSEGLEVI